MSTSETSTTPSELDEARARLAGKSVVLRPYDPEWPVLFEQARDAILAACGGLVTSVEHIGSTSVPGLEAKPVLDLMPGVKSHADGERIAPMMATLGYEYRGEFGIPGRHYFKLADTGNLHAWQHNVHCYEIGHIEWVRHLLFRDALRASPELRDAYRDLKRELAQRFADDVDSYAMAKSDFVEDVIRRQGGPKRDWM